VLVQALVSVSTQVGPELLVKIVSPYKIQVLHKWIKLSFFLLAVCSPSCMNGTCIGPNTCQCKKSKTIRLSTKFSRFFQKMSGYFLTAKIQLSFNKVCSNAIYDLSPTLWKGKNPSFVELLGLLAKEVTEVHFEVVFFVNFFFRLNHW
jgi:hypothetical protein